MAEKPEELDIRDIKLLEYSFVGKGKIELDNEDLGFFEKETWKLFVSTVGNKIIEKQKDNIYGECLIQFFPVGREKIIKSSKQTNKTFLMQSLIKPLFYIKYDENLHIELIDKSGEKIPKEVFFMILCR